MLVYVVSILAVGLTDACLFGYMCGDKWDGLRVTWDLNPFNTNAFKRMPRTAQEAVSAGFSRDASCGDTKPFLGNRYVKDGDTAVMLLYDTNGYIAGIQVGIPKDLPRNYPSSRIQPPWVDNGDQFILTAYFVDPSLICGTGRTSDAFAAQGTGTGLYIQNGTDPVRDSVLIPSDETGMAGTMWTKGKCFRTMGVHYWYNIRGDMDCDEFQPVFLMYNNGRLNAFGWAIGAYLDSPHFEHPPDNSIKLFIKPVPRCLIGQGRRSSIHIYLTDSPRRQNWC